MKSLILSKSKIAFLAIALLSSGTLFAATSNVAGTWKWSREGRDGQTRESSLILKQDGNKVTGVYKTTRGESPIEAGKVSGNELSFKISRETQNGSFTSNYKGKVDGNSIKGSMAATFGDREFEREWVAKREAVNPSGDWVWEMERDNGELMEAALSLKLDGAKVVGTFEMGDSGYVLDLQNGKISGSKLTFSTVFERDGQSMTIKHEAVLKGDTLNGKVSGERPNGESFTREWTAKRK